MRFLVIDDSREIIETLSLCFNVCWPEAQVLRTTQGKRGLELVEEHSPDLVVLDKSLPDINGLDVLRSIRDSSDIPVVMLSAWGQDAEVDRFLEEGAADYVVKPFDYEDLMERIRKVLRWADRRMSSSSRGAGVSAAR